MKIYLVESFDEMQRNTQRKEVGPEEIRFDESIYYDFLLVGSPEKSEDRLANSLVGFGYIGKALNNLLKSYENGSDRYDEIYVAVPEEDRDLRDAIFDK